MNIFEFMNKGMQIMMPVMAEIQKAMDDHKVTYGEALDIVYKTGKASLEQFDLIDKVMYDDTEEPKKIEEPKEELKKEEETAAKSE